MVVATIGGSIVINNIDISEAQIGDGTYEGSNQPPEDFFTSITDTDYTGGGETTSGNYYSLRYVEEGTPDKYVIQRGSSSILDFQFIFEPDQQEIVGKADLYGKFLDFYDVYLYAQIDPVSVSSNEKVFLQYYTPVGRLPTGGPEYAWKDISEINSSGIDINGYFIERCLKFRIYSEDGYHNPSDIAIDSNREIQIDRLRVVITHLGPDSELLGDDPSDLGTFQTSTASFEQIYRIGTGGGSGSDWWANDNDGLVLSNAGEDEGYDESAIAYQEYRTSLYFDNMLEGGKVTEAKNPNVAVKFESQARGWYIDQGTWHESYTITDRYHNFYLYQNNRNDKTTFSKDDYRYAYFPGDSFSGISSNNDLEDFYNNNHLYDYIDWDNHRFTVGVRTKAQYFKNDDHTLARARLYFDEARMTATVLGYGFTNFNYPEISNLETTPNNDPVAAGSFSIRFDAYAHYPNAGIITTEPVGTGDAQVLIMNNDDPTWEDDGIYKDGWINAWYHGGKTFFQTEELITGNGDHEFTDGRYTAWVRVRDTKDHITLEKLNFRVVKGAPSISFPFLYDGKLIAKLRDVDIDAYIIASDPEYYENDVELKIYDESNNIVMDWTNMSRQGVTDYFKLTIDPIDDLTGNGLYTLAVKAIDDVKGPGIGYVSVYFINERPDIELYTAKDGDVVELLYNYEIVANITDQEDDPFDNATIMLYNETGNPVFTQWQNMTDSGDGEIWTYSFDPIDYDNLKWYTISVRAKDEAGYGYKNATVLFQRLAPRVEFEDDLINVIDWDIPVSTSFNVTYGGPSIANFTYVVSSKFDGIDPYYNFTFDATPTQTTYPITFRPIDIPNGFLFLILFCENLTGTQFRFPAVSVKSNYFVDEGIELDSDVEYDKTIPVETNRYTNAKIKIHYYDLVAGGSFDMAYNYRLDEREDLRETYKFKSYPNYRIYRGGTPYEPIVGETDLAFQFDEKPNIPFGDHYIDYLYFNLRAPTLATLDETTSWEEGARPDGIAYASIELKFSSSFDFDEVLCTYEPLLPLRDAKTYNYSLYILEGDQYIETDIEIVYSGDYFDSVWSFTLYNVTDDDIYFMIYGIKVAGEEFNFEPLIYSGIIGFVAVLGWVIAGQTGLKRRVPFKRMSKKIFYVIGGIIGVGIFAAVAGLWYVFGGELIHYAILYA